MSTIDQEHTLALIGAMLRKRGAWGMISSIILLPTLLGAIIGSVTYAYTFMSFVNQVTYAARQSPILASAVRMQNGNILLLADEIRTVADTLRSDGYYFAAFPKIETPILDLR